MGKPSKSVYVVGYGRPPIHTRFAPGQSGNARGRPRGSKNLKADVLEEIGEKIKVREGDKPRSISKQRAVVKAVVMRALRGDAKAVSTLVALLLRFQEAAVGEEVPTELAAEDFAILDRFAARAAAAHSTPPSAPSRRKAIRHSKESTKHGKTR
jgi:hypothetical protein